MWRREGSTVNHVRCMGRAVVPSKNEPQGYQWAPLVGPVRGFARVDDGLMGWQAGGLTVCTRPGA